MVWVWGQFFSRINMYSGYRIIIPDHNASYSRAICGLKECLIHSQNSAHSITSNQEIHFTAKKVQQSLRPKN